jgi:hypothetical protein
VQKDFCNKICQKQTHPLQQMRPNSIGSSAIASTPSANKTLPNEATRRCSAV